MSRSERARNRLCQAISGAVLALSALSALSALAAGSGEIAARDLPQPLRDQWNALLSEMTPESHCAAAYDSSADPERMILRCSMHIRMSAEGARRALKYCEDDRARQNVHAPCRLVVR